VTQTTPTLALVKPGGGSTGLNTPPDRVDIDVLNGNADKIDAFAAGVGLPAARSTQFYGLAANIGSVTPKVGDEYQESDGNKLRWRYDGTNWLTGESGMVLIRPVLANVVNGTVDASGAVVPNAAATSLSVNNVFTSRFRKYRVDLQLSNSVNSQMLMRLRTAGVDHSASNYTYTTMEGSGTTMTFATAAGQGHWHTTNAPNQQIWGWFDLTNPAHAGTNYLKMYNGMFNAGIGGTHVMAHRNGWIASADALTFDGISFLNVTLNAAPSFVKFYGYA
jgi:hypothetical protein